MTQAGSRSRRWGWLIIFAALEAEWIAVGPCFAPEPLKRRACVSGRHSGDWVEGTNAHYKIYTTRPPNRQFVYIHDSNKVHYAGLNSPKVRV